MKINKSWFLIGFLFLTLTMGAAAQSPTPGIKFDSDTISGLGGLCRFGVRRHMEIAQRRHDLQARF